MTPAEEIYQRTERLPEEKIAEVLDFISDLETMVNCRSPATGYRKNLRSPSHLVRENVVQ
ncbi:MAG: DUF2281 domain-containing protein [Magnetococcus sp. THC-1_WYH]